jgi:hypothetical protein
MQSANPPPPAPAPSFGLPLFTWTVPPGLEWWAIAGREPHPQMARDLLRALAAPRAEGTA